jgi:hypothetical protein
LDSFERFHPLNWISFFQALLGEMSCLSFAGEGRAWWRFRKFLAFTSGASLVLAPTRMNKPGEIYANRKDASTNSCDVHLAPGRPIDSVFSTCGMDGVGSIHNSR